MARLCGVCAHLPAAVERLGAWARGWWVGQLVYVARRLWGPVRTPAVKEYCVCKRRQLALDVLQQQIEAV